MPGVPHVPEHGRGNEDRQDLERHGHARSHGPHRERVHDCVHDQAERPEPCTDAARHGQTPDLFREQIGGKPARAGGLEGAWCRRLHARFDDLFRFEAALCHVVPAFRLHIRQAQRRIGMVGSYGRKTNDYVTLR